MVLPILELYGTEGVQHSPSQGLTATAAVDPATQPERKAQ